MEAERLRRDQRELEVREAEVRLKELDKKTELEKFKVEKELERLELENKRLQMDKHMDGQEIVFSQEASFGKQYRVKGPKMPPFEEGKDNMDSYLQRFERYAEVQKWERKEWAIFLSALLKGRALDVYSRLPAEKATDYDYLKDALLKRFQLTEEGFRVKFRSVKVDSGETPAQFLARLESYLLRWMALAKVDATFEGLRDLIIREQYINTCPSYLAVFLKERAPTTLADLAILAEKYLEAHVNEVASGNGRTEEEGRVKPLERGKPAFPQRNLGKRCFICGKGNHISTNCFYKHKAGAMSFNGYRSGSSQVGFHRREGAQANVSRSGEVIRSRMETQQNREGNLLESESVRCLKHRGGALLDNEMELVCGCKLPVVACTSHTRENLMPVVEGFIGEKKVRVLRDTGCSTVVVRTDLVKPEQFTGEKTTCVLIDGTVRRAPVAMIDLTTPYFSGSVRALCMREPLYDVVIGNIPGATNSRQVLDDWMAENKGSRVETVEKSQTVETRQQRNSNVSAVQLRIPAELRSDVSRNELINRQKKDEAEITAKVSAVES